jgi:hypothetical protein
LLPGRAPGLTSTHLFFAPASIRTLRAGSQRVVAEPEAIGNLIHYLDAGAPKSSLMQRGRKVRC